MIHNDVARRTVRETPTRSLHPRTLAGDGETCARFALRTVGRELVRPLPGRALSLDEGGR